MSMNIRQILGYLVFMILTIGTITLAIDGMQHYLVLSSNWEMIVTPFLIFAITYFYILLALKFGILKRGK